MPRVLRRRALSMLDELGEQSEAIDAITSDDGDHVSDQSFEEDEPSGDNSSESAEEMDVDEDDDSEDVSLHQRLLDAQTRRESGSCNGRGKPKLDLKGKNGYKWSSNKFPQRLSGRPSSKKTITPGPIGPAANFDKVEQFWSSLMPDEIFERIVSHTNKQIEHVLITKMANDQVIGTTEDLTDIVEIKALVGLLYYAGSRKDTFVDTNNMWDKIHGISVYRCTMSRSRFSFLCSCLRFDDKQTRDKTDKFAPIRDIWTTFIDNCKKCYNLGGKTTVGEQLLGFRGRCPFRVCVKSETGNKYGIKLITLNDAETSYLAFAVPYLGRDSLIDRRAGEKIPEYFFRRATEPIHGSVRTVTCNSWFTTIPLIDRFVKDPYNLTITGTVRKDRREIPAHMKLASKEVPHANYCFSENVTLLSYTPKKHKIVLVASSHSKSTEQTNGKPNIIAHYEQTKAGTDCFDQLCRAYTTAMRTNRWPMRFFLGMLDQAAVNARILLTMRCRKPNASRKDRNTPYNCLQDLAMHLIRPYLETRIKINTLQLNLRVGIKAILGLYELPGDEEDRPHLEIKAKCGLCPNKSDKKTRKLCPSCRRPMCDEHRAYLCVECGTD